MATAANHDTGLILPSDPQMPGPQRAMLDATPDCVKILSVDGRVLTMNRAGRVALGLAEGAYEGRAWLPLLREEVHAAGAVALRAAATGETVRFPGQSGAPGAITHWDNLLVPIMDDAGTVLSIMCVSRDVTEKVLLEEALQQALDRETLLAQEMRHRVKNLFAMVSGLILVAEREARAAGTAQDMAVHLRGKLDALARASDAVFADGDGAADGAPADLADLIRSVLEPYGERCSLTGATVPIRRDTTTTLTLCLHELATNAMKYGALRASGGTVALTWAAEGDAISLRWLETGGPAVAAQPTHTGFGGQMIDRLVRATGGTIARQWPAMGLVVDLRLPNCVQSSGARVAG